MPSPDLGDVLWNPPAMTLGARNAIISGSGRKSHTRFTGALSIKYMLSGWAMWEVGGRRFRVEGDAFLVLNHGTVYSLERQDGEPTESFSDTGRSRASRSPSARPSAEIVQL